MLWGARTADKQRLPPGLPLRRCAGPRGGCVCAGGRRIQRPRSSCPSAAPATASVACSRGTTSALASASYSELTARVPAKS